MANPYVYADLWGSLKATPFSRRLNGDYELPHRSGPTLGGLLHDSGTGSDFSIFVGAMPHKPEMIGHRACGSNVVGHYNNGIQIVHFGDLGNQIESKKRMTQPNSYEGSLRRRTRA
jgi:hypothetical protein